MVLHRGEPAHPGRAHRHRGHHRPRPGALADPDRPGPSLCTARRSICRRRRKSRASATPCNAASPPRTRKTNSRPTTAGFSPTARPAASACGWTAAWATPARSSRRFTIRCWSRSPPSGATFDMALQRMDRALARIPHPWRQDEHSVPGKRHRQSRLPLRPGHHHADRHHARAVRLQAAPRPRHQAAGLPGRCHRQRQSAGQGATSSKPPLPPVDSARPRPQGDAAAGHAPIAAGTGRRRNSPQWTLAPKAAARHRHHLSRRPPVAAGHARAHLRHAGRRAGRGPAHAAVVQPGNVGRGDVRHRHALPARGPVGAPAPVARSGSPTSVFKCSSAAPTPSAIPIIPTTSSRASSSTPPAPGIDIFRIFDSLNYTPNLQRGDGGGAGNARRLRSRHLLHRRHSRPEARPSIR